MRKSLLVLLLSAAAVPSSWAQYSEFGLLGGVSFYMGELNPDIPFKHSMPAGGVFYRHNFNDRFSARAAAHIGYLMAADSTSSVGAQIERNLHFQSWLFDFSLTGEFNFFRYEPGNMERFITPFIFGGLSFFKFNPQAEFNGELWELQPLGTEGQGTTAYPDRKKYTLTTFAIPFGIGVKVNLNRTFSMGLEWGMRYTFTDYLDDISSTYADVDALQAERGDIANALSNRALTPDDLVGGYRPLNPQERVDYTDRQRGNSRNNDWYSFALISISANIKARPQKCPAYD